jgi:anti-anti-sigma factor
MDINEEKLGDSVYRLILSGRMDVEGVGQIETRFAAMTASPRTAIIVDMAAVPFMSSIGIRALLMNAKAVKNRGGRLVLLNPDRNVRSVLESSAIDQLIPLCDALDDALAKVVP